MSLLDFKRNKLKESRNYLNKNRNFMEKCLFPKHNKNEEKKPKKTKNKKSQKKPKQTRTKNKNKKQKIPEKSYKYYKSFFKSV